MNSGASSAALMPTAEGAAATDVDDARRVRDLIDGYPEVLTPVEAAVLLRTSASTMGRLIRMGDVPATKVGGRWRLLKSALLEFLAASSRP